MNFPGNAQNGWATPPPLFGLELRVALPSGGKNLARAEKHLPPCLRLYRVQPDFRLTGLNRKENPAVVAAGR